MCVGLPPASEQGLEMTLGEDWGQHMHGWVLVFFLYTLFGFPK